MLKKFETDHIYHMTAQDMLAQFEDDYIDLIIADMPYGIAYAAAHTAWGGKKRVTSKTFGDDELQTDWLSDAHRVLKSTGALYLFTRWDQFGPTLAGLHSGRFKVAQRIVWDKAHWGQGNLRYFGTQPEDIFFCPKPDHRLRWSQRTGNIWRVPKIDVINNEGNFDNPTQKPESLIKKIIRLSTDPGDLVVDPFCGSGTTAAAARSLNRRYICCDRDAGQFAIATARLAMPTTIPMFE